MKSAQSSLQGVETLVRRWKEEAAKAELDVSLGDADLAERVRDSLATVTSALEQAMPRAVRRRFTLTSRRGEELLWTWKKLGL